MAVAQYLVQIGKTLNLEISESNDNQYSNFDSYITCIVQVVAHRKFSLKGINLISEKTKTSLRKKKEDINNWEIKKRGRKKR